MRALWRVRGREGVKGLEWRLWRRLRQREPASGERRYHFVLLFFADSCVAWRGVHTGFSLGIGIKFIRLVVRWARRTTALSLLHSEPSPSGNIRLRASTLSRHVHNFAYHGALLRSSVSFLGTLGVDLAIGEVVACAEAMYDILSRCKLERGVDQADVRGSHASASIL